MRVMFLNNHGGGFADHVDVEEGASIGAFFASHFPNAQPADYLIRVNRLPATSGQILQDNDRVTVTPTKIEGA
jgi:hypothetical protein